MNLLLCVYLQLLGNIDSIMVAVAASALANEPRGGFAWPATVEPAGDGERSE